MKKTKLILLAGLAMAVSLTGCQKKEVKPGDVAGYDEGEQYLSIWVHSIEDTPEWITDTRPSPPQTGLPEAG